MGVGTERETLNINVSILSYHFTLPLLRGWVRMRRCQAKSNKQRMQRLQCRPCNRRPRSKRERVVKVIYKYKTKLTTTKDSMRNKWFCFGDLLPHQQVAKIGIFLNSKSFGKEIRNIILITSNFHLPFLKTSSILAKINRSYRWRNNPLTDALTMRITPCVDPCTP